MKKLCLIITALLMAACTTTQYVPVESIHTVEHHHTDSVHHTDSIIKERNTVVMQLDSATMARYGIQLKNAERAWLVRTAELEREISRLSNTKTDTVQVVDTIRVPYPVAQYVEKKESMWQRIKGDFFALIIAIVIFGLCLFWVKKHVL